MAPLYYKRSSLILLSATFVMLAVVSLFVFIHPAMRVRGAPGLLLNGNLGHYVIVPLLVIGMLLVAWRTAMVATGSLEALVADRDGVRIITLFATRDIAWRDLILAKVIATRVRYSTVYSLRLERHSGAAVRLSLGLVDLDRTQYDDVVDVLRQLQYEVARGATATSAAPTPSASRPVSTVNVQSPSVARGFGRKGL